MSIQRTENRFNKIINSTKEVTEHFNSFFSTVANNIGSDVPNTEPLNTSKYFKNKKSQQLRNDCSI